jgi:hypothetical protein
MRSTLNGIFKESFRMVLAVFMNSPYANTAKEIGGTLFL